MYKVITPVAVEPVTLAEARLQLKLTADDSTAEDSLITGWITTAREIAEHYTGRALASQTLEMALDCFPEEDGDILLDQPPVSSITSISYTDTAGVSQTFGASNYALSTYGDSRRVSLAYGSFWPTTQDVADAVRIRYVTGYSTTPRVVKDAIRLMVTWLHEHRGDEMDPNDIQPPAAKALLGTVKVWSK